MMFSIGGERHLAKAPSCILPELDWMRQLLPVGPSAFCFHLYYYQNIEHMVKSIFIDSVITFGSY